MACVELNGDLEAMRPAVAMIWSGPMSPELPWRFDENDPPFCCGFASLCINLQVEKGTAFLRSLADSERFEAWTWHAASVGDATAIGVSASCAGFWKTLFEPLRKCCGRRRFQRTHLALIETFANNAVHGPQIISQIGRDAMADQPFDKRLFG